MSRTIFFCESIKISEILHRETLVGKAEETSTQKRQTKIFANRSPMANWSGEKNNVEILIDITPE